MIERQKWAEIIKNFHETALPEMVRRDVQIPVDMPISRAISLIGPRRAGKTYEMFQIIKTVRADHGKENALYVNFERADLTVTNPEDLMNMLRIYTEIYPDVKKENLHLFLDEIQNVPGWERFVRTALDDGIKVYLSGSSSKLLSREIATSMRGRSLTYTIFPFSFKEFLRAKGIEKGELLSSSEKANLLNALGEYMNYGGYPEVVIYPAEREKILREIMETAIYRDVIERGKIRNLNAMKLLISALLGSKEFSVNKFHGFLKSSGVRVAKNALYAYLRHLDEAFFVFTLNKFSNSYKKAERSIPKVYFVDNGLMKTNGIDDKGRLMENMVFLELLRRGCNISYYKTPFEEVDFVIRDGKTVERLIQVCYDASKPETKEREVKALLKAGKEFNCHDMLAITYDYEAMEDCKWRGIKGRVRFMPLWKWLLAG